MSVQEICDLRVPTAKNAVLYEWATAPKLLEALAVMKAWGFSYRTQMIWDKRVVGLGYWTRGVHEIILIGVKGKFSPPAPSLRIPSIYSEKRTFHSKKPDYIRDMITKWYPDKLKIELFARNHYPNWTVWGNEVVLVMMMDENLLVFLPLKCGFGFCPQYLPLPHRDILTNK